jgi:Zn-dependent protease with chaperone function
MKNEFNRQGLYKLRATVIAGLLALPAVLLTAHQYGWQGLLVASSFVGMVTARQHFIPTQVRALGPLLTEDRDPLSLKVQQKTVDLCHRMGMKPMFANMVDDPNILCQTDLMEIRINRDLALALTDAELDWVLAHELDHVSNGGENKLRTPFIRAADITILGTVASAAGLMTGAFSISIYNNLTQCLAGSAVSVLSFMLARASVEREAELRSDANALRVTGDPQAALGALEKLHAMAQSKTPLNAWQKACEITGKPLHEHPSITKRADNIAMTYYRMQQESPGASPV